MKKNILCIDDSNTALLLLEYALNEAGFKAILASSIEQAINWAKNQKPDLILLDLSIPDVSGYEFLKMRKDLKLDKVPIIVVSAYDSKESVASTLDLGAVDFISKPIRIDSLIEKINAILG